MELKTICLRKFNLDLKFFLHTSLFDFVCNLLFLDRNIGYRLIEKALIQNRVVSRCINWNGISFIHQKYKNL